MKENLASTGRWLVVGAALAAIAVLVVLGLGRTRGSRTYRWRMALWTLVIGLTGGTIFWAGGCDTFRKPMCYDPVQYPEDVVDAEGPRGDTGNQSDEFVYCYAPDEPDRWVEPRPTCYLPDISDVPRPDEPDARAMPDLVMCYADVQSPDLEGEPPDAAPADSGESGEVLITCYKMVPDMVEDQGGNHEDDASGSDAVSMKVDMMMCYFAGGDPPE